MKKYILVLATSLVFAFACSNTNVLASRNDERDNREHQSTPKPTKTPTPTPKPTPRNESHNDRHDDRHDDRRDDDRHDRDHEEDCDDPQDPTSTPTPTVMPTPTPVDPTQTPVATQNPDVCPNLEGVQTNLPDEYHFDTAHYNCLKFELGGPSQSTVLGGSSQNNSSDSGIGGASGQVLGASTMAGTGVVEDSIFYSLFSIGSLLTSVGIMKNGKKK